MEEGTVDYIEVFQGGNLDEWFWRGKSDNGEIVSHGEGHPSPGNALRAAKGAHPGKPGFKMVDGKRQPVD